MDQVLLILRRRGICGTTMLRMNGINLRRPPHETAIIINNQHTPNHTKIKVSDPALW